jgi:hypothetical protein
VLITPTARKRTFDLFSPDQQLHFLSSRTPAFTGTMGVVFKFLVLPTLVIAFLIWFVVISQKIKAQSASPSMTTMSTEISFRGL